jgi:hypothetical protein
VLVLGKAVAEFLEKARVIFAGREFASSEAESSAMLKAAKRDLQSVRGLLTARKL